MTEVTAMMTGIVDKVRVSTGEEVQTGQELLIIESMKMFNSVVSPIRATVREVRVQPGDFVQEGDVLIVIE